MEGIHDRASGASLQGLAHLRLIESAHLAAVAYEPFELQTGLNSSQVQKDRQTLASRHSFTKPETTTDESVVKSGDSPAGYAGHWLVWSLCF